MIGYLLCVAIIILGCACIWYNVYLFFQLKAQEKKEQFLERGTAIIESAVFDGLHIHREYHGNQILTMYDARALTGKHRVMSHTKDSTYIVQDLIVNETLAAALEEAEERKYQHHLKEIHAHGHC